MRPAKKRTQAPAPFQDEDLLRLQLQVAKRADKLWEKAGGGHGRDLVHWLQAEREVLERYFGFGRPEAALRGPEGSRWLARCVGSGVGGSARAF